MTDDTMSWLSQAKFWILLVLWLLYHHPLYKKPKWTIFSSFFIWYPFYCYLFHWIFCLTLQKQFSRDIRELLHRQLFIGKRRRLRLYQVFDSLTKNKMMNIIRLWTTTHVVSDQYICWDEKSTMEVLYIIYFYWCCW